MSPLAERFLGRDPIRHLGSAFSVYEFFESKSLCVIDPTGLWIAPPFLNLNPDRFQPLLGPKGPRDPLGGIGSQLAAMCTSCCSEDSCECASDGFDYERSLNEIWNTNYGDGAYDVSKMSMLTYCFGYLINRLAREPDHTVGGCFCYNWSGMLYDGISPINRSSCLASSVREVTHKTKTDPSGNPIIHLFVEIKIGKGGPDCTLYVDDGFETGRFIHIGLPLIDPDDWSDPHDPTMRNK